ncbi:hypothetical protein L1049_010207 [Liquidambar formosana]|uniref:Uncharacterized protein n=1 Tax=Liquidambar formosana TaxID=63359 RepID=A0AAP0N824_LIQFO
MVAAGIDNSLASSSLKIKDSVSLLQNGDLATSIYSASGHGPEAMDTSFRKTGKPAIPFHGSATFGRPLLAVPIFAFQVMPTFAFCGSGAIPWTPALGSSSSAYSSTHSGTPWAAFAPTVVGTNCVHGPLLGQGFVSSSYS